MMTPTRSSFRLPYAHYALIYLDSEGKLKVDESPSIQEQNSTVFTPEVRQNFLEILGEKIGFHQPITRRMWSLIEPALVPLADLTLRHLGSIASPRQTPPRERPWYFNCR